MFDIDIAFSSSLLLILNFLKTAMRAIARVFATRAIERLMNYLMFAVASCSTTLVDVLRSDSNASISSA